MSKKKPATTKPAKKTKKRDPAAIEVFSQDDKDSEKMVAQTILRPSVQSAATIKAYNGKDDSLNINALITELGSQIQAVHTGDLKRAESMLIAQAHTLDALFGEFARRAKKADYLSQLKDYMNISLKAQRQCCMTLEALAEIKNPRPYIQNNRAQYQQVNNGTPEPRAGGENSKSANGLLEDKSNDEQWLDTGAPETAGGKDKELETVGAKHRAKN